MPSLVPFSLMELILALKGVPEVEGVNVRISPG